MVVGNQGKFVMGLMMDENNQDFPNWNAELPGKPLDKYYTKYSYGASASEYTRGRLGDATFEVINSKNSWYDGTASMVQPSLDGEFMFARGSNSSLFSFTSTWNTYYNSIHSSLAVLP